MSGTIRGLTVRQPWAYAGRLADLGAEHDDLTDENRQQREEIERARAQAAALQREVAFWEAGEYQAELVAARAERDALKAELAEARAAIEFLHSRQIHDGPGIRLDGQRCRGRSADAMAWYGIGVREEPHRDEYPCDRADLAACERTLAMAPRHVADRMQPVLDRYLAALDAPQCPEDARPVKHIGGRANAEDCPACTGDVPYPWICPGEPERPEDTRERANTAPYRDGRPTDADDYGEDYEAQAHAVGAPDDELAPLADWEIELLRGQKPGDVSRGVSAEGEGQ